MNVTWTATAAAQLQAIRDYLAQSSPGYAQALAVRIIERADSLASQPLFGAEVPEYGDQVIRELFEHPYRILYRVADREIQILAVIHASRRLPRTPPN
jgi:plasmid stabilization system protein ParE